MSQLMADKKNSQTSGFLKAEPPRFSFGGYLALSFEMTKISILSAMEYRISFLMQVFGMIVNDIFLIFLWFIFFKKFPVINGWQFKDMALLYAITTVNFAVFMIFCRGGFEIARTITRGELDYYLTLPRNVLWHLSVSKTEISAIGDLIFGVTIYFLSGNITLEKTGLFLILTIISAIIFFNFIVITQSIAFFVGNFEEAADQLFHSLLGFTLYPQTVFSGILKMIMLTIIPAFFIATLPVRLINSFNLKFFLLMLLFTGATFILAIFIFKKGLKRYESGNLLNVKM